MLYCKHGIKKKKGRYRVTPLALLNEKCHGCVGKLLDWPFSKVSILRGRLRYYEFSHIQMKNCIFFIYFFENKILVNNITKLNNMALTCSTIPRVVMICRFQHFCRDLVNTKQNLKQINNFVNLKLCSLFNFKLI